MRQKENRSHRSFGSFWSALTARGGIPRLLLLLAVGFTLYLAWIYAASAGLTRGFSALFDAWGLTNTNLALAPGWARWLARNYGSVVSLVSSLGAIALSALLLRLTDGRLRPRLRAKDVSLGALAGGGGVLVSAVLFCLLDSMRATHPLGEIRFSGELLLLFIVYLAAAGAEEAFVRAFVLSAVRDACTGRRQARLAGCLISAAALVLTTGALRLGAIGAVNVLLFGLLCALLYQLGRPGLSLGLRFAWSYAAAALVRFPGGNTAAAPLMELYHVSEPLLTGGNGGLICGLWMTALLFAAAAWGLIYARKQEG